MDLQIKKIKSCVLELICEKMCKLEKYNYDTKEL